MKKTTATINEIAHIAGVSKTTVSRYINGKYEYMSEGTRRRIEKVIADKDYRPSNIARSMKLSSTRTLGCVVVDISNPITSIIVQGILDAAREYDYSVLFSSTGGDPEKEKSSIESFLLSKVDGLLVNPSGLINDYLLDIKNRGTKIVIIDRIPKDQPMQFDAVRSQNENAIYECVEHLNNQGYKSVALFHIGFQCNQNFIIRRNAYLKMMRDLYKIDASNMMFEVSNADFRYAYEADLFKLSKSVESVKSFISMPVPEPKAIFSISATAALSTLWALQKMELDDFPSLGFCNFNDWGTASIVKNGITTITQDAHAIGYEAFKLLLLRLKSDKPYNTKLVEVPNRLMIRTSTKLKKE